MFTSGDTMQCQPGRATVCVNDDITWSFRMLYT